ncbi:hypothetical protein PHMEG_0007139 [Phytophthora megakarya]|uniref:Uncharacterized protein n=1 Tax=Phytophthora megakarya TaxID=4795 RepID=A0A225WM33_9STRA|nr:hypothetical protein PHMEG_0007139 [Phytophthora megakarya]
MELYTTHEYKLKRSLKHKDKLQMLEYGDVPTYVSDKAWIKLTLEPRVVISVSLPKRGVGKTNVSYLSNEIGAEGIIAKPKIARGVKHLPFPTVLNVV